MATDEQTTRIVRSWLQDGRTTLPDRVLDAVLADLPATPQRRPSWPVRRAAALPVPARLGTLAAVIAVAVIGLSLAPGLGPIGGPVDTPSPAPTSSPSVQPSPSATPHPPPLGNVASGRYAWTWSGGRIVFQVPAGWSGYDGGLDRRRNTDFEVGLAHWLPGTWTEVSRVYVDACGSDAALIDIGPTTADLVDALDAQVGTDATVTEMRIGGLPATRVDLVVSPGTDRATCRLGLDGPIQVWNQEASGYLAMFPTLPDGSDAAAIVWSVDVGDDRLIFTSVSNANSDPLATAEIEAMVGSMTFE